jgi:protein-disulfide isomerase
MVTVGRNTFTVDAAAKVAVVEFSDYQCPFCGAFTRETFPQLRREYIKTGKIRYVFKAFPLERTHPLALRASIASECAADQGRFLEMHERLFADQRAIEFSDLERHARDLGLKTTTFEECLRRSDNGEVRQDVAEARRLGITTTPTFLIGKITDTGEVHVTLKIRGNQPYEVFRAAIDRILNERRE